MKRLFWITAALLACWQTHGQGTVNFSNIGIGADVVDQTTGTNAIAGTTFSVALYCAPDGVMPNDSEMTHVGAAGFIVGTVGTPSGLYSAGTRTAPLQPPGAFGWFQVRAWETIFGTTYEEALLANVNVSLGRRALAGVSSIVRIDTSDPTQGPPEFPASIKGISGIVLTVVPEPSLVSLALLGTGVILLATASRKNRV